MNPRTRLVGLMIFGIALLTAPASAAGLDDNIEWAGVSHIDFLDRAPRCPIDGESFVVSFQTYHYDIGSARLYVDDGTPEWVDASFAYVKNGVYDVWEAVVPATTPTTSLEYYIELTDGSDTDYLGPGGMSDGAPGSGWQINFNNLLHAPLGCTLTSDGGAVFKVWAPNAGSAYVAGSFNGWNGSSLAMAKSGGVFTRKVNVAVNPGDQYKYVFPGGNWKPDPRGRAIDPSNYHNSVVEDPDGYVWGDDDFIMPDWDDLVIYELHVGTFSGYNDGLGRMGLYRDVVDAHIDHLLWLGVNAVELMPITEFDYFESWGYNPISQWAAEEAYGNPDDLKYLIDKLHQNGIAVLLDVVFNHYAYSNNFLWWYDGSQIYFDDPAVDTPWGSQGDFDNSQAADYYVHAILHWLEEYHIDGFRMDATRYMRDNWIFPDGQSSGWTLMQRINDVIDNRKVQAISIAEELPNDQSVTNPTSLGGAGFDSQWHDVYNDDVRQEVFDAAYGDPEMSKISDAIAAFGWDSKRKLVRYVESHDEAGNYERLAVTIDSGDTYSVWVKGRSKLAQGLTILAPGIPMFLMGGEWLEDIKFDSGYDNRIDWGKAVGRSEMTLFFRDVINVKKSNCAFRSTAPSDMYHNDDGSNVIAMHRWCAGGNDIVVVASLNNSDLNGYRVGFPQHGTWYEILNSQASDYAGNGSGNGGAVTTDENYGWSGMPHSAQITVPQMGLLVFRYNDPPPPPDCPGDCNCDGERDYFDINYFLEALGGESQWAQYYRDQNGGADPPCAFIPSCDPDGDGDCDYFDINPFLDVIGEACP